MSKNVSKLILKHERYELVFPQERGWTSARSLCSSARRTRLRLLDPLSDRTSLLSPSIPSNTLNNTKRSDRSICAQGCNFNDTLAEPLPLDPPHVKKKNKTWKNGTSACITMLYNFFVLLNPCFYFWASTRYCTTAFPQTKTVKGNGQVPKTRPRCPTMESDERKR